MRVFLETERLILRRFTDADVGNLVDLDSDPAVMRYITGGPATPREEIETDVLPAFLRYYDRFSEFGFWAVLEKPDNAFIGWFHFRPQPGDPLEHPQEVELGYRLKQSCWGKGYATEGSRALIERGFRDSGLQRVVAFAYGGNLASRRVMEKVGMRLTRTFRLTPEEMLEQFGVTDPNIFDGDDVEYAITRAEWERQSSAGLHAR
ncbi:MAG: GNAT family N-acetyltransferase [Thermomicrobiales bacterium]